MAATGGPVRTPYVPLFLLTACGTTFKPSTTDTTGGTDDPTDTVSCAAVVQSITPGDGDLAPVDTTVTASFDGPIAPTDPYDLVVDGATGTVALAVDGRSITWTGDLEPERTYTVTATVCGDEATTTFETTTEPLDLTLVDGLTYVLPWASVVITEPEFGSLLQLDVDYLLAQFLDVDPEAESARALGTMAYAGPPDGDVFPPPDPECAAVSETEADFSQNPLFEMRGSLEIVITPSTGATVILEDFVLAGVIGDAGTTLRAVTMTGKMATEDLTLLKGQDCGGEVVQALGGTCVPCVSSDTGYCLLVEANAPVATRDLAVDIAGTCAVP